MSSEEILSDLDQHHPALMAPLWAVTLAAVHAKMNPAAYYAVPRDRSGPALVVPTMLLLPPHHGLLPGQIFAADIDLDDLKAPPAAALGLPPRLILARSTHSRGSLVCAF
jgi:hypothetical protein